MYLGQEVTCVNYALRKAAEDSKNHYPKALEIVTRNFYPEVFIMFMPSEPETMSDFEEITSCLKGQGIELRK